MCAFVCNLFDVVMLIYIYVSSISPHLTPLAVPSAPPSEVRGEALDSRSIEISWDPPPSAAQNGQISGYKLLYSDHTDNLGPEEATVVTVSTDMRSHIIRDLEKWTPYKIWLSAFTQVGDGPRSDVIVVKTDEDGMYY